MTTTGVRFGRVGAVAWLLGMVALTATVPAQEGRRPAGKVTIGDIKLNYYYSPDIEVKNNSAIAAKRNFEWLQIMAEYTSEGARLIEGNGRMGGEYVRDWVRDVWGVDLVEENLMAAAGIPVKPFMPEAPLAHLDGDFIIPAKSGVITAFELPQDARESRGFHELRAKKKVGDRIAVPPDGYERAGMLVAKGASRAEAERNLQALKAKLRLDIKKP